jgi:hypothetical protein
MAKRIHLFTPTPADRMALAQQIAPHDFHRRAAIVGCGLADVAICGYDAVCVAPLLQRTQRLVNGSGLRRTGPPTQAQVEQTAAAGVRAKQAAVERRRQMAEHMARDRL